MRHWFSHLPRDASNRKRETSSCRSTPGFTRFSFSGAKRHGGEYCKKSRHVINDQVVGFISSKVLGYSDRQLDSAMDYLDFETSWAIPLNGRYCKPSSWSEWLSLTEYTKIVTSQSSGDGWTIDIKSIWVVCWCLHRSCSITPKVCIICHTSLFCPKPYLRTSRQVVNRSIARQVRVVNRPPVSTCLWSVCWMLHQQRSMFSCSWARYWVIGILTITTEFHSIADTAHELPHRGRGSITNWRRL